MGEATIAFLRLDFGSVIVGIRRLSDKAREKFVDMARLEAEYIKADAVENYVPKDKGHLAASAVVPEPTWDGDELTVSIQFGGVTAPYAAAVHEHPSEFDPPSWQDRPGTASSNVREAPAPGIVTFHPAGRGPKYLEWPMRTAVPGMKHRLIQFINSEVL